MLTHDYAFVHQQSTVWTNRTNQIIETQQIEKYNTIVPMRIFTYSVLNNHIDRRGFQPKMILQHPIREYEVNYNSESVWIKAGTGSHKYLSPPPTKKECEKWKIRCKKQNWSWAWFLVLGWEREWWRWINNSTRHQLRIVFLLPSFTAYIAFLCNKFDRASAER